jgi:hypothetical protein
MFPMLWNLCSIGVLWTLLTPSGERPLPATTISNQTKPRDISLNLTGLSRELWPLPSLHNPDSHSLNHGNDLFFYFSIILNSFFPFYIRICRALLLIYQGFTI